MYTQFNVNVLSIILNIKNVKFITPNQSTKNMFISKDNI